MNKFARIKRVIAVVFFAFLVLAQNAHALVDEKIVEKYIRVFSDESYVTQVIACKELEYAGISDTRIYDIVEKNLLANYSDKNRKKGDYSAWLAKALIFSGNEKYRESLEKVRTQAALSGVRKHTAKNLPNLKNFERWNKIIVDTSRHDPTVTVRINQYANMLRSGERALQIFAAKRVNWEKLHTNTFLLDIIDIEVKKSYLIDLREKQFIDAMAFMIKMLAASGMPAYRATVATVEKDAKVSKVRRYAKKFLIKY